MCIIISIDEYKNKDISNVISIVKEELTPDEHATSVGIGAPDLTEAWQIVSGAAQNKKRHYRAEVDRRIAVIQAALLKAGLIR